MSSQQNAFGDPDKTVVLFTEEKPLAPLPFTPVAVAPGRQVPPNMASLAQQTSLDDYTPGLNPLVNAASRLLLEIIRLRHAQEADPDVLRLRLEAEIRSFNAQASTLGVSEAQINAAQYMLCTALDECISTSGIAAAQNDWQQHSLLSTFHQDTWGGEVFFDVLARTMEQPASRLYLLELAYLLLSLGFEGKYRLQDRGQLALESLRDQVYRQIRLLRGEPSPDLAKKVSIETRARPRYSYIPLWLTLSVMFFGIAFLFAGFFYALHEKSSPLLSRFESHALTQETVSVASPALKEAPAIEELPEDAVPSAEENPS